ncbi:PREDICTED: uncharacterized protein LOC109192286 [Ipomoea nil]|uniref:uncharacterized protein LOC109192286 n=1 Tax=Ipomoea nil TaxID=35883 RepID=UPI00090115AA|nr:PREDICTED: uncharacterized protein LOC109192286 [Ipomoea nil]
MVQTPPFPLLENAPVSTLIREESSCWDADNGIFTVRGCYKAISTQYDPINKKKWSTMWKLNIPRKVKVFAWQACSGCLPTADHLRSRRVDCQYCCSMCQSEEETTSHLFINCSFAKECWDLSGIPVSTSVFPSFEFWVDHHVAMLDKDQCRLLLLICWRIWLARNNKIWNNKITTSRRLVEATKLFLADWNSALEQASSIANTRLPVIRK